MRFGKPAIALLGTAFASVFFNSAVANERGASESEALLTTAGDPADPRYANAGDNLRTGVASLFITFAGTEPSGFLCTATAIDRRHVVTAAHCLRNTTPEGEADVVTRIVVVFPSGVNYQFDSNAGQVESFDVHPLYDALEPVVGAFAPGDIAVIRLTQDLPADVESYDLYRDPDEFGQATRHYGHGRAGKGNKGDVLGSSFFYARTGLNRYEQVLAPLFIPLDIFDQLLHDFDSGGRKHNAMEWWFTSSFACHPENAENPEQAQDGQCTTFKDGSYPDFKGFDTLEVGIAPGDSGGPGFIDGKLAGVHSFGFTHSCEGVSNGTDFSCGLNSSFGEMSGDTRVSSYADWIDDVVAGSPAAIADTEAAAKAQSTSAINALSARSLSFLSAVLVRHLRKPMDVTEFEAMHRKDAGH